MKKTMDMDNKIIQLVEELPTQAAKAVLEEYQNNIPFVVKDAIDEFYNAMNSIDGKESISVLSNALRQLKQACEANPDYKEVYEAASKEAKESVADIVANNGLDIFNDT